MKKSTVDTYQPLIEDSYLTLKHYKEPLIKIPKKIGYGFYGCLLASKDGKYVQCHICGKLFGELQAHVRQSHRMDIPEYREKFKLAKTTALISEDRRLFRKERTVLWMQSLTDEQKEQYKQWARDGRNKRSRAQPQLRLETKNKRGTCPDQLLEKIKEVAIDIGKTPSKIEFIWATGTQRYVHLIYKTFGSWGNAIKMAKLSPLEKKKGGYVRKYTNEELLEYLLIFTQENGKVPTFTDFKRGLLPSYSVYTTRFGSIEKARRIAGVYNFVQCTQD
jgi:hypothetical protein